MEKRRNQDQSGTSSKKRFKPAAGPPMEAMDHEVLSALETWSDAMQEASDMLDKYAILHLPLRVLRVNSNLLTHNELCREACSSVLEELLALHERVQTKQNVGDTASLRALITSQFPKTCLDILRSLGDFDTMRLTECVTAALNIDQQMSDGKNLGDEELSALGREKILELDKLGQRNDQLVKEFEAVRKEEEEAISHHTEELQKTRSSFQQLRAEEEKLRKELEEVDSEAAAHLAVLEKFAATSTGNPGQAKDVGSSADTAELSNSIWKSDEIQKEMSELLRTRGSVDRARDGVHAAQSHLTLMHYVCEFSSEVRRCMETYCNDELLGALQRELEALQQDKAKLDHIAEQLKSIREESYSGGSGVEAGRPGLARTGSLRDKYRRFYTERIQDMRSKHFKARHTASGLLSYFAAEAAPQRAGEDPKSAPQQAGEGEGSTEAAKVVQLALDIISLVDNLQKIANENCSPDEAVVRVEIRSDKAGGCRQPIHEVLPEKAASTLALFSVDKEARMWRSGCITKCVEELGRIAEKPSLNGRLAVKDCDKVAGTDLCGIIDAVQGGVGGSSLNIGEASAAAGCVCQALDEVCKGKSRTVLCLVPYVVLKREAWSAEDGLPKKTVKFPLLSAALLHTRVEHTWVQKIAVIDLVRPTTPMGSSIDAQILQLSPIMDAEGRPEVDAEKMVSRTQGGEAESAEAGEGRAAGELGEFVDRWRRGMEQKVLPGLKQFKPQLIL
eukprot:2167892-Rhodomonas_salina.1